MKRRGWAVPAVILTSQGDTRAVVRAMLNGADDCLAKPYDPHELVTAVGRAVGRCIENQQAEQWRAEIRQRAATLSPRERAIVSLVVAGLLNKQIGDRLNLALVTVKVHRGRAMRKLGARSAADLAHLALSAGITRQY
jgi:FixJ family two-component response regulator